MAAAGTSAASGWSSTPAGHAGHAAVAIAIRTTASGYQSRCQPSKYQARIAHVGIVVALNRMTDDWKAAVDAVAACGRIDPGRLAYLGMSMGARFGLALAADMNDRLCAVVIGKFGLQQCSAMHPGMAARDRVTAAAARITAPLLFHVQHDGEIFPRDSQLELFDLIGSPIKRLVTEPGRHAQTTPAAIAGWRTFIAESLTDGSRQI
jgi:dienelactone hydrolase